MKNSKPILVVMGLVLFLALFEVPAVSGFSPHQGDTFAFSEVVNVGNGTGPNYNGYTEQTTTTGTERVNTVYSNNGTVSEYYSFTWTTVNNVGLNKPGSSSGNYTYSSTNFMYLKGTDNQSGYGYYKPTVWFAMDSSTPQGGTFTLLNTLMTVQSTNYNYRLSSQNENVYTIYAQGANTYQRNDVYGKFSASYTWNTYFDPTSGYIVGYTYTEQDTNSTGDGFTYTDNLSVTSSSYPLSIAPATSSLTQYLIYIAVFFLVILLIVILAVAISRRRRRLPKHLSFQQAPQQYPQQPPPQINLTPKEPPVQQIVVKEIVKVKCKYCGALIDATVQSCPFCGAPRT